MIKATNRKSCPEARFGKVSAHLGHQRLDGALLSGIGQGRAGKVLLPSEGHSNHPVCSWRESLPYLYYLGLQEVKLGAQNSNPGKNGPL